MKARIFLAALVVLLTGCASKPLALSPQAQRGIESVHAVLYVPQTNLDVDVTPGNPGNTGLLGALIVAAIDEARRTSAQKALVGITDAVNGFDFRGRMSKQLSAELARVQSVRMQVPVQLEITDTDSQRRIAYDRTTASAVLFTRVNYKLIDGKLSVVATAVMYPKAKALMALRPIPNNSDVLNEGNQIYRHSFAFIKQAITRDNVRDGLAEGLANVAWQLAADINHIGSSATAALPAPLPTEPGGAPAPTSAPPAGSTASPAPQPARANPNADANARPRQRPDGSPIPPRIAP